METAAANCGVNVGTISRMEAGKVPNASFDTWIKVCEGLGLDVSEVANPPLVLETDQCARDFKNYLKSSGRSELTARTYWQRLHK